VSLVLSSSHSRSISALAAASQEKDNDLELNKINQIKGIINANLWNRKG